MVISVGRINNFENCYIHFSFYKEGVIKADLLAEDGQLLLAISKDGESVEGSNVLYLAKQDMTHEKILNALLGLGSDVVLGAMPMEDETLCVFHPEFLCKYKETLASAQ